MLPRSTLFASLTVATLTSILGTVPIPASAGESQEIDDLLQLPLNDLLNMKVTSVSRRPENLLTAAAAIYVVTDEDIKRMGANNIPEALRMVPGIQVASIDGNKWSVSSRGFAGRYANKLLVQIDGRSVYTHTYSGVYWDMQNFPVDLIDRIEIIRGPGATQWGANAVNGVINIITKNSRDTQSAVVHLQAGNKLDSGVTLYGGTELSEDTSVRGHFHRLDYDDNALFSDKENANDSWRSISAGFRLDSAHEHDNYRLQGEVADNKENQKLALLWLEAPPFFNTGVDDQLTTKSWNLLGSWEHRHGNGGLSTLQGYWDKAQRNELHVDQEYEIFNLDYQYNFPEYGDHQLMMGAAYRHIDMDIHGSYAVGIDDKNVRWNQYSAFAQDEITLIPSRLKLIVGSKFEHHETTGFNVQPSVRALLTPKTGHTFWASISRAVRTPSMLEDSGTFVLSHLPEPPVFTPVERRLLGNSELDNEVLKAYELGYRYFAGSKFTLDAALFFNDYDDVISYLKDDATTVTTTVNSIGGHTYGGELSGQLLLSPWWTLKGSLSHIRINMRDQLTPGGVGEKLAEDSFAENIIRLHSLMDLSDKAQFDAWLYYVDELPVTSSFALNRGQSIDAYTSLNLRFNYKPKPGIELSATATNLLDDHLEYVSEFFSSSIEIEPAVTLSVRWSL